MFIEICKFHVFDFLLSLIGIMVYILRYVFRRFMKESETPDHLTSDFGSSLNQKQETNSNSWSHFGQSEASNQADQWENIFFRKSDAPRINYPLPPTIRIDTLKSTPIFGPPKTERSRKRVFGRYIRKTGVY